MSLLRFVEDDASYPGADSHYLLAQKIVSICACVLSIFGAFIVIFSFLFESETGLKWKEVYKLCCGYRVTERVPKADEDGNIEVVTVTKYKVESYHIILINLSIADIVVASSHLWGLCSDLEDTFSSPAAHAKNASAMSTGYNISCTTQAAFTAISTMSSFFWTGILAVFLAFNIVFSHCTNNHWTGEVDAEQERELKDGVEIPAKGSAPNCCETPFFLYVLFPVIGWGLPIAMTVVFAVQNQLGYTEDYDPGWCYFYTPNTMSRHQRDQLIVFGYEFWLWGSVALVLLCTIIYSIMACYNKQKYNMPTHCTEFRYISVGIAFALLRLPSTVTNIYLMRDSNNFKTVAAAVLNIIASATLSLQGGVNGIVFLCCRRQKCCLAPFQNRRHRGGYAGLN